MLQGTVWMRPLSPIEATATAPGPARAHQASRSASPQDSSVCEAETHRIVSHLRWHGTQVIPSLQLLPAKKNIAR